MPEAENLLWMIKLLSTKTNKRRYDARCLKEKNTKHTHTNAQFKAAT